MRSNGLSPKPVEWRQPEQLGFYTGDANGMQQLEVRACPHLIFNEC